MNRSQQSRFNHLYQSHVKALKRQGKSHKTIDAYARAVRRIAAYFERCPDRLTIADLKDYFSSLVQSHSWSTVKLDRNGLQFFYKHVLDKQWQWVDIVKPPQVRSLPDILTPDELALLINSNRELRYQVYILTTYSMGLRLGEALNLKVGDIDAQLNRVHVRNGKGRGPLRHFARAHIVCLVMRINHISITRSGINSSFGSSGYPLGLHSTLVLPIL
jgi:integrase